MWVWGECSSGLGIASPVLMVTDATRCPSRRKLISSIAVMMLLTIPLTGVRDFGIDYSHLETHLGGKMDTSGEGAEVWSDGGQPWPQFGRTPSRIAEIPSHGPEGGAGLERPENATSLLSVVNPSLNWEYGSYSLGTDSLATPIANLSSSIEIGPGAEQRCGQNSLFTVLVQTEDVSGNDHSMLRLIEGEDSELAWQVDLGVTEEVKAAPAIVDIDEDGKPEIIVAYDSGGSLFVEVWSPRLSCSVTGWTYSGHSSEILWTWTEENLMIGSDEGPYTSSIFGSHRPTTQILLADLDLDGDAELVVAAIDEVSEYPVVLALPLQTNGTPNSLWEVSLNKGSHPSDPTFVQIDENTGFIILTTIEASNGQMWAWKISSSTGSLEWGGGLSLDNLDGDTNTPHIRLPGPVVANLDDDSDPEIILTIPSDADGSGEVDGAEYIGIEISDGSELWTFRASNGFADAPPTAIDTNNDGEHDRVCWVTWWQTTTDRHGATGCHDVGGSSPNEAWVRDMDQSSGNPNDEIAVSAATWMDIDGEEEPELLVAYGRSLWAFEGSSGSSAGINGEWSDDFELEHRTWSSPSLADIDGDAAIDIVLGSMVVSMAKPDVRPLTDGRGIEFNPSAPDPGEQVTVTAYVENAGTLGTGELVDVSIFANGIKIGGAEVGPLNPSEPSGSGSFASFSVEWSGGLGDHTFEIVVDPFQNLSQTRYDNDIQKRVLSIVPPYNATFEIPTEPIRVDPGSSQLTSFSIRSTGRLSGSWTLDIDDSNLPEGWIWEDRTSGGISMVDIGVGEVWYPVIRIEAPESALGSDSGYLGLTLRHDDGDAEVTANLPIEANRTRGLSIRGPDGTSQSTGFGLVSEEAMAWLLIENRGNAEEEQIAISWESTEWGSDLRIFDSEGEEVNALSLSAGEKKEVTARLPVPTGTSLGETVSTPLSMCVGFGDEEECSQAQLSFVASSVTVFPSHLRSVPTQGLEWQIHANLPDGTTSMNWSLTQAGMVKQGWSWGAKDEVSISDDSVVLTGESGSRVSGTLTLDLPPNARPAFHLFEEAGQIGQSSTLSLSLEVLQIHRSGLEVNSPSIQPFVVDVEEENLVVLRLENSGNGDDSYSLSYHLELDQSITYDPGIVVTFSSNPVELGAGGIKTIPLTVVLPEDTPARVPVKIIFTMTSEGNKSVSDFKEVVFEVRQDHRWEIESENGVLGENGTTLMLPPGSEFDLSFKAKNVGNLVDDISLEVGKNVIYSGSDESTGWEVSGGSAGDVGVNDSVNLSISIKLPVDSWNGSKIRVEVSAVARDETVFEMHFFVEVTRSPGWWISSSNANLEISPEGSAVRLDVTQVGNKPSKPYVSAYISGQRDWTIGEIGDLPEVDPGETVPVYLNITPPETATHEKSVELHVRVRDGDSSGLVEITLPLRVSIFRNFSMEGEGPWLISSEGGYPKAVVRNGGNSPETISFQILGLPEGWSTSGSMEMVLGVGEERGVPIELIPDGSWSGSESTVRILSEDSIGNQREIILNIEKSEHSWASSPFIRVTSGDEALVSIHGADESSEVLETSTGRMLQWSEMGWLLPSGSSIEGSLVVNGMTTLDYVMTTSEHEARAASCSIGGTLEEMLPSCSIGNGSSGFVFQVMLIGDGGRMLDYVIGSVPENESSPFVNLSSANWNPDPGIRSISIRMLDERGFLIASSERTFEVRRTDWNIGIENVEIIGEGSAQLIKVQTKRLNEKLLSEADCKLSLDGGGHYSEHIVEITGTYVPAPEFERPDIEDGDELIVSIGCSFPWDLDSSPNDNDFTILMTGGSSFDDNIDEFGTGILAAILVIGIYAGLAWIVSNHRERERMMKMAQAAIEQKISEKRSAVVEEEAPEAEEDDESRADEEVELVKGDFENSGVEDSDEFDERLRRLLDR